MSVSIPIVRDGLATNDTSFKVILSNATGGITLGRMSTSVSIMNGQELGTFRAVASPFDTALTIERNGGFDILTWNGNGQLQRADRPEGPWQKLTNATSPYALRPALPATSYRRRGRSRISKSRNMRD